MKTKNQFLIHFKMKLKISILFILIFCWLLLASLSCVLLFVVCVSLLASAADTLSLPASLPLVFLNVLMFIIYFLLLDTVNTLTMFYC